LLYNITFLPPPPNNNSIQQHKTNTNSQTPKGVWGWFLKESGPGALKESLGVQGSLRGLTSSLLSSACSGKIGGSLHLSYHLSWLSAKVWCWRPGKCASAVSIVQAGCQSKLRLPEQTLFTEIVKGLVGPITTASL